MKVKVQVALDSIDVFHRKFDRKGRCVEEQIERYTPVDENIKTATIGFDLKKSNKKK